MTVSSEGLPGAIRAIRSSLGETQTQFALRIDVAVATLARYETGDQIPKRSILNRIAELARRQGLDEVASVLTAHAELVAAQQEERRKREKAGIDGQIRTLRQSLEIALEAHKPILERIVGMDAESKLYDQGLTKSLDKLRDTFERQSEIVKDLKGMQDKVNRIRIGQNARLTEG